MNPTRRWVRWTIRTGVAIVAVVLLGALGVIAFLTTQAGRDAVARLIGDALSDDTMTVSVAQVGGDLLSAFRIGEVRLADRAGETVVLQDARVVWRPAALLGGTLDIRSLRVRRIATDGFAPGPAPEEARSGSPALPPVSVSVGDLTVDEIALGPAVLGEAQHLSLSASAALDSDLARARLKAHLVRRDGAPARADIDVDYAAKPARFAARLDVEEPTGGPIARFAGLPRGTPLSATLDGAGPPDRWHGKLAVKAGDRAAATADLVLAVGDKGVGVSLDGTASLAALLPAAARPLAGSRIDVHGVLDYGRDGVLAVKDIKASSAALSVTANGRYVIAHDTIDARLSATLRDPRAVSAIVPFVRLDAARVDATLGGTVAKPALDGHLDARGLSVEGVKAAAATGQAKVVPASGNTLTVAGNLQFSGLDAKAVLPDGLLGSALDLRFEARARPDGSVPRLAVKAASGAVALDVDASVDGRGAVDGRYALRHDRIDAFATDIGLPVRGRLDASGPFTADLVSGRAQATVAGTLDRLAADEPWLRAALGQRVAFSGRLQWDGDDELTVAGFDAKSAAARLTGAATIRPASDRVEARYAVSMADLRPLSSAAGLPLSGSLSLTGTAKGPTGAPAPDGPLALRKLAAGDVAWGNVTAEFTARPSAAGFDTDLRLGGDVRGKALSGTVALAVEGTTIRAKRLTVAVGRNRIAGDLSIEGARPRLAGTLTATFADLADLPTVAGVPTLTAGKGTARFRLREGRSQEIAVDAKATGVATDSEDSGRMSVAGVTATAVVRDPFGTMSVDGKLGLSGLRIGSAALDGAQLTAGGALSGLDWAVTATARNPSPLSLSAGGRLSVADRRVTVAVQRLQGKVETHSVSLRAPARIDWSPRGLTVGSVDLSVAGGRLRLSAAQRAESIEAEGEVTDLPIALAAPLDPRFDLAGALSGRLHVSGSPRRPVIDIALTGTDIRPPDVAKSDFAGLAVTADLRQSPTDFQARLTVKGPEDTAGTAELRTGPLVSLSPLHLTLPPDLALSGRLDAAGNLSLVDRIIGLGGDRLGGRITAKARLAGTVARPDVRGDAELSNGAYEGVATGVVIRGAKARVTFTGNEARLVSLSASDGNHGQVSGSGAIAFAGGTPGTGALSITLRQFAALRRPEADITASGTLAVKGSFDAPSVQGKLTVDRGELRIPDRLPEEVVELDVVEINGRTVQAAAPDEGTGPSPSHALPVALDIAVAFPGRTFVRGRGLDSEWKGDLHIGGTAAKPKITGKLTVVRGTFAFAGKTFTLASGSVSFAGDDPPEPEIEAVAQVQLDTVLAQVQLSGKTSRPKITVTSEPALPQEEVLSQILFGRSTGQLSALQAARLAQTAATLSGAVSGPGIIDKVRQALGVDVLDVDSGDSSGHGASLKAGKYLTDNVFVSVSQGTDPGSQKVGVEVEVLPHLSVESDISGTSNSNVGVNWKFDY